MSALVMSSFGCSADGSDQAATTPPETGADAAVVVGVVVAGPTQPETIDGDPDGTAPLPGAVIVVRDADGGTVTQVESDAVGSFRLELPPGRYALVPQPVDGMMGTPAPVDLDLDAAEVDEVRIEYDTGVR